MQRRQKLRKRLRRLFVWEKFLSRKAWFDRILKLFLLKEDFLKTFLQDDTIYQ